MENLISIDEFNTKLESGIQMSISAIPEGEHRDKIEQIVRAGYKRTNHEVAPLGVLVYVLTSHDDTTRLYKTAGYPSVASSLVDNVIIDKLLELSPQAKAMWERAHKEVK